MATFMPSTKPASFRPWVKARRRSAFGCGDEGCRNPITGIAGCSEQRKWERNSERLGSFEVEDQLDFGGLLDWQISRFVPFENASCIDADLAVRVGLA